MSIQSILRQSQWDYVTSNSLGASAGLGGALGSITLKDPRSDANNIFYYAELGIGAGVGAKAAASIAGEGFWSIGSLYMTDTFKGVELSYSDISGVFLNMELSVGFIDGGTANALMLGISAKSFLKYLAFGGMGPTSMAKAALLMTGLTVGPNFSAGAMGYVGYLYRYDVEVQAVKFELAEIAKHLSQDHIGTKFSQTAQVTVGVPPIELPGDVLFDCNKHVIKPAATTALQQAGMKIRQYSGKHIVVQGFADSTGSDGYNLKLSQKRADEVRNWLISKGFVSSSSISAKGYGESYAIASNATAAGRARNRRVEIKVFDFRPRF